MAGLLRSRPLGPFALMRLLPAPALLSVVVRQKACTTLAFSSSAATNSPPWSEAASRAASLLSEARSVLFVTGAGISAESGLPTYRGVSGLYNDGGSAVKEDGMSIEECLSGTTYRTDPSLTWKYLLQIERACRGAEPSRAHDLVAATERHVTGRVTVMTQNVDGLHVRAGSTDVLSLHGELHRLYCTSCGNELRVDSYEHLDDDDDGHDHGSSSSLPPRCDECGGPVRPAVVLFDEYLGDDTVRTYEDRLGAKMTDLAWTWSIGGAPSGGRKDPPYDVSVCIGTSALFAYVNAAALSGRRTIEINPDKTSLSDLVDVSVPAGATEALEYIFHELGWSA